MDYVKTLEFNVWTEGTDTDEEGEPPAKRMALADWAQGEGTRAVVMVSVFASAVGIQLAHFLFLQRSSYRSHNISCLFSGRHTAHTACLFISSQITSRRFTVLGIATAFYLVFATASSCNSFFVTASWRLVLLACGRWIKSHVPVALR